ncbi:MAG: 4a-hydroxytetrahydrobiopterin dehydratase [Planctomycetes bacterium]|nr:4a-hydroxytetrahydrobiopterin dehydratase [Planctomycetota bacterium]
MDPLAARECVPCTGGIPSLPPAEVRRLLSQIPDWEARNDLRLFNSYVFPDFVSALDFTNRIGHLAEDQSHHPDIHLAWGRVGVEIWTHRIDGLTESDFILAAKIDEIALEQERAAEA